MIDILLWPIRALLWNLWCRRTHHKFMPTGITEFTKPGRSFTLTHCLGCNRYVHPSEVQHALNMIEAELDRMDEPWSAEEHDETK